MKQKLSGRLFLFFLLFLTWLDTTKFGITIHVSKIGEPIPTFPQIQIELLKSKHQSLVDDAIQETSSMLLQYFVPQLAKEAWETNFIFADLLSDAEPEVVFSLSLPPDRGALVILQKKDDYYFIVLYDDNLLPIKKLEVLPLKGDKDFLVTREDHREQLGAFCETSTVKLWRWKENSLHETFTENIYWDINWLNSWQNPHSNPAKWYNLNQALTITYRQEKERILIRTEGLQQFAAAPTKNLALPAPYEFTTLKTRNFNQEYYWDSRWQKFILQNCSYLPTGEKTPRKAVILKDLDQHLESLAFKNKHNYQIIDEKGNILSIEKASAVLQ